MGQPDTEDDDEELYDREDPDDADVDDSEGEDTYACPECGQEVYEGADRCPHCGHYGTGAGRVAGGKRWWMYVVVGLLVLSFSWWVIHFLVNVFH